MIRQPVLRGRTRPTASVQQPTFTLLAGQSGASSDEIVITNLLAGSATDFRMFPEGMAALGRRCEELERRIGVLEEATRQSGRPSFLAALEVPHVRVRVPIPIVIHVEEDSAAVHAPDLEVFGAGETEPEALSDLRRVIVEEFEELGRARHSLGPDLLRRLNRFSQVLERLDER